MRKNYTRNWNSKISKDLSNISGVYKITNLVNGKIYVGSSVNLYFRLWFGHLKALRENEGFHHNSSLQSAFNFYGEENFTFEVLETCERNQTFIREQHYLDTLLFAQEYIRKEDNRFTELGYNKDPYAIRVSYTYKNSEERLKEMSQRTIELWKNPEYRKNQMENRHYETGWTHEQETIDKISSKAKQRFIDEPERKLFYKELMAEPERKQKSIEDSKKLWQDPEYRAKIKNPISSAKQAKSLSKKWKEDSDYRERRIKTWNQTKSDPNYVNLFKQQVLLRHTISGEEIHFASVDDCWQFFFKQHLYPDSLYQLSKSGDTYQNYTVTYLPKPKKILK